MRGIWKKIIKKTNIVIGNGHNMYESLLKNRIKCKSYSSRFEFALSSVSVIRFHIKFMMEDIPYDFCLRQYMYRRVFGPSS